MRARKDTMQCAQYSCMNIFLLQMSMQVVWYYNITLILCCGYSNPNALEKDYDLLQVLCARIREKRRLALLCSRREERKREGIIIWISSFYIFLCILSPFSCLIVLHCMRQSVHKWRNFKGNY